MKKILVITSSPRKGNSEALCDEFIRGAIESGNDCEKIRLADKKIGYCKGCEYCSVNGAHCNQKDDALSIIDKMAAAEIIVLATPVYFYCMSAQLKTFIDRTCGEYTRLKNKEFYYILSAADTNPSSLDKVVEALRGFTLDCLPDARDHEAIMALGVWHADEIGKDALNNAYEAGKNA